MSIPDKNSYSLKEARELMKNPKWETISVGDTLSEPIELTEEEHKEFITKFTGLSKEMEGKIKNLE